jgi:ABC-type Fe3+/spermidine/putrescine transport system ATPase subunit
MIHQGQIVQTGTPQELLQRPKNLLVARFMHAGNLFLARVESDGPWLRLVAPGGITFRSPRPPSGCPCGEVTVMVRPENIHVFKASSGSPPPRMPAETTTLAGIVRQTTDLGPLVEATVACGQLGNVLVSLGKKEFKAAGIATGDAVLLAVAPEDVHVLEADA